MKSLSEPFENLVITTVGNGPFFIDELFKIKFSSPAPYHGHAVMCFYRKNWGHFLPVCYTNFLQHDETMLVGGVMTDGRAFKHMASDVVDEINASGGIYYYVLRFAFDHFKDDCEGYFGHTADPRAIEVGTRAGYRPTIYEHLIAYFHKPLHERRKRYLIEKANDFGPF